MVLADTEDDLPAGDRPGYSQRRWTVGVRLPLQIMERGQLEIGARWQDAQDTQAYSPLGVGALLSNPTVTSIAGEYGKTPAQVLIRWSLQLGNSVIPRSSSPERIAENLDVFGFELAAEHMDSLNGLDDGTRYRPDPATYTGI